MLDKTVGAVLPLPIQFIHNPPKKERKKMSNYPTKRIIIGGNFGKTTNKQSGIVTKLAKMLNADCVNGGSLEDLEHAAQNLVGYNLIIWMPNVSNETAKIYPKKAVGSVLICSKVLTINAAPTREHRTEIDAIERIFKMHGNAVIAIKRTNPFSFKLIDALGNVWTDTTQLEDLVSSIECLTRWTKKAIRVSIPKGPDAESLISFENTIAASDQLDALADVNRQIAKNFEATKGRFFGNSSTRCTKLFPTARSKEQILWVSRRNVNKKYIQRKDFVPVKSYPDGTLCYFGDHKPSVDTPIQSILYNELPSINYMIHGHSYVKGVPYTRDYFPCGDCREATAVKEVVYSSAHALSFFIANARGGVLNLLNHGFLMYAENLNQLKNIASNLKFEEREIGFEFAQTSEIPMPF
jgi:ribulose-5-phosphate 4-epimerase/fuculose-1-phosphate aldolase